MSLQIFITHEEDCPESSKQIRRELKSEDTFEETKSKKGADIVLCGLTSQKVFLMRKKRIKEMMKKLEKQFPGQLCVLFITHYDDDEESLELCREAGVHTCADFDGLYDLCDDMGMFEEETDESDEEESEEESDEDSEED